MSHRSCDAPECRGPPGIVYGMIWTRVRSSRVPQRADRYRSVLRRDRLDPRGPSHERHSAVGRRCRRLDGIRRVGPGRAQIAGELSLAAACGGYQRQADIIVAPSQLLRGVQDAGTVRQPRRAAIRALVHRQPCGRPHVEWDVGAGRVGAERLGVPAPEGCEEEEPCAQSTGLLLHR